MTRYDISGNGTPARVDNTPALISAGITFTYRQYHQSVAQAAAWFRGQGVKKGDRVGIIGDNSIEYILSTMALICIGAVACPISTRFHETTVSGILDRIGCRTVVVFPPCTTGSSSAKELVLPDLGAEPTVRAGISEADPRQEATIVFTSGTGALPKAVLHTYGSHYYSALGSNKNIVVGTADRWLLSLPLYHVGGLGILFRCLISGAAVVVPEPREPLEQSMERHQVTHLSVVPTQLKRLISNSSSINLARNLKAVLVGGSSVDENLVRISHHENIKIFTSYGLTEMASQVTTSASGDPLPRLLTSGKLLPHRELMISDKGEILVRGETRFEGYVTLGGLERPFNRDGWFATGDLGHIDNDGYLKVTGRKDNMFVSGGENIHPEQIEKAIMGLPGIEEAIVVGVDDDQFGKRPVAFVKTAKQRPLDSEKIVASLSATLPRFKIPIHFFEWPQDDGEISIKPSRHKLAQIAARRISGDQV
ncbi:MAG: o-succinylbenzoate--CoA ligase [Candidatus Zixiibacteriota bacterium]